MVGLVLAALVSGAAFVLGAFIGHAAAERAQERRERELAARPSRLRLACMGARGDAAPCERAPRFATWCDCPAGFDGRTLASTLFLFCAECVELDLEADPTDEVLELEELAGGALRLRPRDRGPCSS
jgi:hypothetical protein